VRVCNAGMADVIEYAKNLIRFDSTSALSNAEVSEHVEGVLGRLGCETERIEYQADGVLKVCVLGRKGRGSGGLAWFGHTDVVPAHDWAVPEHGAFEPVVREGRLYGRGSTDMKGPIAAMLAALAEVDDLHRPVYVSCTADEEVGHVGAIEIAKRSELYRELVAGGARGIVGEPTGLDVVHAHKGGCLIQATARGKAGHSGTREGVNANLKMIPFLTDLKALWDETESDPRWMDERFDPPTVRMNVGINDHNEATNITSPISVCTVNLRPLPGAGELPERVMELARAHGLEAEQLIRHAPFWREPDSAFVSRCVELASGRPARTVSFGTEACNFDGVKDLVVLGPGDIAQAHKNDEWISLEQLKRGQEVYANLIRHFCQPS